MALTYKNFDIERVVFEKPKKFNNKSNPITLKRIYIRYDYPKDFPDRDLAGRRDVLSIKTPNCMSYGLQEKKDMYKNAEGKYVPVEGSKVQSYSFPIVMFDANSTPSEEVLKTVEMFEAIAKRCRQHMCKQSTKEELECYRMDALSELMEIFYRKMEKGLYVEGASPVLSTKVYIKYTKNDEISIDTNFEDVRGNTIDPLTLIDKRCYAICDVIIDNIFIGNKPSIQVKVNDVIITSMQTRKRRLFIEPEDCPEAAKSEPKRLKGDEEEVEMTTDDDFSGILGRKYDD